MLWEACPATEGGHSPLMLGAHGATWHLELVDDPAAHADTSRGPEDLLVLYLGADIAPDFVSQLLACGGRRVTSPNRYWERWGVTISDPDGYRLA